jgi:hypothetical protein
MENEVPGPRVPGPVPVPADYSPVAAEMLTLESVKNYSQNYIRRLVPSMHVIQQGNAQRTITTGEGLTQESYIVQDNEEDDILVDDLYADDISTGSNDPENLFANSLLVEDSSTQVVLHSARDVLKPQINELLQCLDIL